MTPILDRVNIQKVYRHPELIWYFLKGDNETELTKRHLLIHLAQVTKLPVIRAENRIKLVCEAIDLAQKSRSGSCYHQEYLYLVCREIQPKTVVETGVHSGISSAFILKALNQDAGSLYSIDLPNIGYTRDDGRRHSDPLPVGVQSGFSIPNELLKRWHFVPGDSREKLPELLGELGKIDMFIHDSAHVYDLMKFEFETVYPSIRKNGLLLSDDATWSDAFEDFCVTKGLDYCIHKGIGVAQVN